MTASDRLRKAAILIDTLDTTRADALLDQMPASQRDRIRETVMELEHVTTEERESVIAEFLGPEAAAGLRKDTDAADSNRHDDVTVEFSTSMAMQSGEHALPGTAAEPTSGVTEGTHSFDPPFVPVDSGVAMSSFPGSNTTLRSQASDSDELELRNDVSLTAPEFNHSIGTRQPFSFLRRMEPMTLAACLEYENPQAIALVISQLEPEQATSVVSCFAPRVQAEVVRRMSRLEDAEPEVMIELEDYLRGRLSTTATEYFEESEGPGIRALARMLETAGPAERRCFIESLAADRPALARHFARQFDVKEESIPSPDQPSAATNSNSQFAESEIVASSQLPADGHSQSQNWIPDGGLHHAESSGDSRTSARDWTASFPVSLEASVEVESRYAPGHSGVEVVGDGSWMATRSATTQSTNLASDICRSETEGRNSYLSALPSSPENSEGDHSSHAAGELEERTNSKSDDASFSSRFAMLSELDSRSLATLLQHADPDTLLIALAGAPKPVFDNLMNCLTRREARRIRTRIEKLGPIRLDDIEYAQRRLEDLALELHDSGLLRRRRVSRAAARSRKAA